MSGTPINERPQVSAQVSTAIVREADTVKAVEPSFPAVASTPYLVAIAETACMNMVKPSLKEGLITVGTRVVIDHLGASKVGATLELRASLLEAEGRRFVFAVVIKDGDRIVANVEHHRVAVNIERLVGLAG